MKLTIKYFGVVREITNQQEEFINFHEPISIENLLEQLSVKYPELKNQSLQLSVDLKIQEKNFVIDKDCEVGVLPPFAGG